MDDENIGTTDSIRDSIVSAFESADTDINNTDTTQAETSLTTDEPQESNVQRTRDQQGRFTKAEQEAADAAQVEQVAATPVVVPKKSPAGWKQELKAQFETLPPEVQDEIIRRESDYGRGIQKYSDGAKFADEVRPAFEQWMPYLSQIGATPVQAFNALIQSEYRLRTGSHEQKRQEMLNVAKQYGIDLGVEQQDHQPNDSREMQQAIGRVQHLEDYIRRMEYNNQQTAARQQQQESATLTQEISEFASKPENIHFDEVRADMQALLSANRADSLADAYDKACWARPDIRASLLKNEEAKRIQERADIANKAKAKSLSITGSPSGASIPVAGASIRADLEAAFASANRI